MNKGIFILISLGVLGGLLGAMLVKKMKVPQVLGYILTGVLLGTSGFKVISEGDLANLGKFNVFALALIGLLVGYEIKISDMKKYGKQFSAILLGEGLGAFVLVSLLVFTLLFWVTGSVLPAIAGALVFGAISAATDPASTMSVLWENKSAGILTTTLIAVIALDDALAMLLYGLSSGLSQALAGSAETSMFLEIAKVSLDLVLSLLVGSLLGLAIAFFLKRNADNQQTATVSLGLFLLAIALSVLLHLDIILVAMSMGFVVGNSVPKRSRRFFDFMKGLADPVYVVFFVLIGARLAFASMPLWLWGIVALYILGRSLGKIIGAYVGARVSSSPPVVKKYIGLGLFCQGGVAIGLSIVAGQNLQNVMLTESVSLGDGIIAAVASSTFLIQIIGPAVVRWTSRKSLEAGKDINIEDLIAQKRVNEVSYSYDWPTVYESTALNTVLSIFSNSDLLFVPVLNENEELSGVIHFDSIKPVLLDKEIVQTSLAMDFMDYQLLYLEGSEKLGKAMQLAENSERGELPVLEGKKFIGLFSEKHVRKSLQKELMEMKGVLDRVY